MINIHNSQPLETSHLINIDRLQREDIKDEHVDAFLLGYYDRTCEELDQRSYVRINAVKTVLELFYKAGYILAHHDIEVGAIYENVNEIVELRTIARDYLYRFNVKFFYEKNS